MPSSTIQTELNRVLSGTGSALASGQQPGTGLTVIVSDGGAGDPATSSGGVQASSGTLAEAIGRNTSQLAAVQASLQSQLDSIAENTRALADNTSVRETAGSAATRALGGVANTLLGGGLLGPIASGLMSLFGGGGKAEVPPPLVRFALPAAVNVDAGVRGASVSTVDYGQSDRPRASVSGQQAAAPQVVVNVRALDSRSFLDHSGEIASAVRRAILESSSLNDVIGDM
jgi:hypothetical protein